MERDGDEEIWKRKFGSGNGMCKEATKRTTQLGDELVLHDVDGAFGCLVSTKRCGGEEQVERMTIRTGKTGRTKRRAVLAERAIVLVFFRYRKEARVAQECAFASATGACLREEEVGDDVADRCR